MASETIAILERNLDLVRKRISQACDRCGRNRDDVTLVAVTKYVDAEITRQLYQLGLRDFGESRPQSLWEKQPVLPEDIRWHLIGHWQTNKVRRTVPLIAMAHSLDRWELAKLVDAEAARVGRRLPVLLEVKLVDEEAKHGFLPDELRSEYPRLQELLGLEIRGLMCMASLSAKPEECRPTFRRLRELRDELESAAPSSGPLPFLSMGMSQDFEIAIEEGATHIRVGSVLFEGLEGFE